jgi:outer membrane protein assembly factor BamB
MTEPSPDRKTSSAGARKGWLVGTTLSLSVLAVLLFALVFHLSNRPWQPLRERQPGMDQTGRGLADEPQSPIAMGKLITAPTPNGIHAEPGSQGAVEQSAPALGRLPGGAGDWPQFRGPKGDGVFSGALAINRHWGGGLPATLWSVELGEGYAGAAVLAGRVFVLDYDATNHADALRCLSLADGRELWRFSYPVKIKRNHGMSRTTPAVTEQYIVSLGPKCHVICLDTANGHFRWGLDLVRDFGAEVPQWYAGQCPLIVDGCAILAVGGNSLMLKVDCVTGKTLWSTPNDQGWKMTHSSVVPMEFAGRRMYVYCASGGVVGVSADDGRVLWETDQWKISIATIATPVPVGEGKIFLAGGYNAGSLMLQLKEVEGNILAQPLFRLKPNEFGATQQTPIFYQDHIYGVRPDGQLACLDLAGKVLWTSGAGAKFGLGPFLIANGLIFVLNDDGLLTLAEAEPSGYHALSQAQVLDGHDAWAPLALAGGRLLARDLTRMVCLDVTGAKK